MTTVIAAPPVSEASSTVAFVVLIILLAVSVVGMLASVVMLVHNERVSRFRTQMLDKVSDAVKGDVEAGRGWEWRYEAFEAVEYMAMANRPWVSLQRWYPDYRGRYADSVTREVHGE